MKILTSNGARCLVNSAHNHMRSLLQGVNSKSDLHLEKTSLVTDLATTQLKQVDAKKKHGTSAIAVHDDSSSQDAPGEVAAETGAETNAVYMESRSDDVECSCGKNLSSQEVCAKHLEVKRDDSYSSQHGAVAMPTENQPKSLIPIHTSRLNSFTLNSGNPMHDLKRFLDIVGTEPKEARYWFKYFQKMANSNPLFAVIQLDDDLIKASELIHRPALGVYDLDVDSPLNELCSYLGFLQRHNMKCVVVHGRTLDENFCRSDIEDLQNHIVQDGQLISDLLEKNGAMSRLLSIPPVHATRDNSNRCWNITKVDPVAMDWAQHSGTIPILSNLALTNKRQLIQVELFETTSAVSKMLLPLKVMIVNMDGGLTDQDGKIIPNINLPHEESAVLRSPWCTPKIERKIHDVRLLLTSLHEEQLRLGRTPDSAVILTASSTLLTELFTHYGSGTFFKITEKINVHTSFEDVDTKRLTDLIHMSFGKNLEEDFIESISKNLDAVFISEGYSAAAIITREPGIKVPYLDKFVVRKDQQDNSIGRMLWERVRHKYPQLFWRSKNTNLINPWYFKRSEGSWSVGEWTVFWYGIKKHNQSAELIDCALTKSNSFKAPDPSRSTVVIKPSTSSQWSALQYMTNLT